MMTADAVYHQVAVTPRDNCLAPGLGPTGAGGSIRLLTLPTIGP